MTKSIVARLTLALSSAALVAAAGCGGSSGGTGAAGQGGGGTSGVAGASSAGAGGSTAGSSGTAGVAGSAAGSDGGAGAAGSDGAAGAAGSDGGAGSDGAAGAPFETVTIPDALAVPSGATLKFRAHGRGTQNYACVATTAPADGGTDAGVTTYAWGPATPAADLYDETNTQIGTHFAGPTWMSSVDGSDAVGSKVASVASTLTNTIPWLLLNITEHMGSGVFMDVTYVQRLNTANGGAPATGCDAAHPSATVSVDYTADYYFYSGGVAVSDAGVTPTWPFTTVTIPDTLAAPTGATLKLKLHGWGAQIYACLQSGGADGGADAGAVTYAWGPATPSAKLYDDANTQQGTHSAGPTWTANDTSAVVGARLVAVDAPATGAIQWLLLKAASHAGSTSGVFSDVTYVQRLNTANGVAPATGCDAAHVNMTTSSSYSADYYFYTGGDATDGGTDGG